MHTQLSRHLVPSAFCTSGTKHRDHQAHRSVVILTATGKRFGSSRSFCHVEVSSCCKSCQDLRPPLACLARLCWAHSDIHQEDKQQALVIWGWRTWAARSCKGESLVGGTFPAFTLLQPECQAGHMVHFNQQPSMRMDLQTLLLGTRSSHRWLILGLVFDGRKEGKFTTPLAAN